MADDVQHNEVDSSLSYDNSMCRVLRTGGMRGEDTLAVCRGAGAGKAGAWARMFYRNAHLGCVKYVIADSSELRA